LQITSAKVLTLFFLSVMTENHDKWATKAKDSSWQHFSWFGPPYQRKRSTFNSAV